MKAVSILLAGILLSAASPCLAAESAGQADLDKASEAKLTASADTDEIIRLLESALKKGLDPANTDFANRLLTSTLIQRARESIAQFTSENYQEQRKAVVVDLEKAIKLDSKQPQAYLLLAQLDRLPGGTGPKSVRANLDKAIENGDEDPETKVKALVLRAALQEQPKKRLADLDEAVRLAPDNVALLRERGLTLFNMDKPERALADFSRAVKLEPNDSPLHQVMAVVLARLKKFDEALAEIEKARKLEPNSIMPLVQKARIHAQQKKYDAAIEDLKQAMAMKPGNAEMLELLLLRAGVYQVKGDAQKALDDVDEALKLRPGSIELLAQKARIHAGQKDYDAAIEDLNQAWAGNQGNVAVLLLRADVYLLKGDKQKALADLNEAARLKPGDPLVIRSRAQFLAQENQLDEAIAVLDKLVKKSPKDISTLIQLAAIHAAKKNWGRAIEINRAVLTIDPAEWRALRGLGDAMLNTGRHTEAIAYYEKAFEAEPNDDGILNNYAWVLATSPDAKIRNGRRAIQLAEDACKQTDYKVPHILSTLAAAYAETGDFDKAMKWSAKAIELAEKEKPGSKDAEAETKAALKKELENYKAKRPTRELISDGLGDVKKP